MKEQIKVLMLLPNLRVSNGVTSYAMNYFKRLDHSRVRMDFAVYSKRDNPYEEIIRQVGSKVFLLPSLKKHPFAHFATCKRILSEGNYDIIHDNSLLVTYPMMKTALKYVQVRILHSHNSKLGETAKKEKRNKLFLPILIKYANEFAACSEKAAKAMFKDAEYQFIPNVVDADEYQYDPEIRLRVRTKMGAEGKKIIGTIGRVAAQKNPFFALDVFDIVAEKEPAAEYWWVGSGPLDQKVAEYAANLKHGDRVKLLGSRNDVKELYQAIDVFFLPSFFEGLPVTGIEAQATGLPCVISDTVTRQVVYTDLVSFVSLNENKVYWAEVICKCLYENVRTDRRNDLLRSNFASENAGLFLEEYYSSLIKR